MTDGTDDTEYGEDEISSGEEPDLTILSITGTPINLETYVEDSVALRSGTLKPSPIVQEGEYVTIVVTVTPPITNTSETDEGGVRLIFKDADNFEPGALRRVFVPIPSGSTGTYKFQVNGTGKRHIIVIARAATRPIGQPNNVKIVDPKLFWVANLRII